MRAKCFMLFCEEFESMVTDSVPWSITLWRLFQCLLAIRPKSAYGTCFLQNSFFEIFLSWAFVVRWGTHWETISDVKSDVKWETKVVGIPCTFDSWVSSPKQTVKHLFLTVGEKVVLVYPVALHPVLGKLISTIAFGCGPEGNEQF